MRLVAEAIEDPLVCVVHLGKGERVEGRLAELLLPVDIGSIHRFRLEPNADVELHYHDFDEYWLFTAGEPTVTLRAPHGTQGTVELQPYDMVACLRGVEHTLSADHELVYIQFRSVPREGERPGHLVR